MTTGEAIVTGSRAIQPWGQAFAGFRDQRLSGQVTITEGDRAYAVAFADGVVVGASSPLATDGAVRVARLANMISPNQVSTFVRRYAGAPERDEIPLLASHANLSSRQQAELRKRVVAQRAARTFSPEQTRFVVDHRTTIDIAADCELDARAIIYLGARQNRSEIRLAVDLAQLGSWFRIKPDAVDGLAQFGFGDVERSVIERLRDGGSLDELERCAPGIEVRMVRAVVYALAVTGVCEVAYEQPRARVASAHEVDDLPAPVLARDRKKGDEVEDLLAPVARPRRWDIEDLPAPLSRAPRASRYELAEGSARVAAAPADDRDRNDTVIDAATDRADLVGVTVDGRYVLERKLGDNAMRTVYLAHHTKLNRLFAVKILHRRVLGNTKLRRRFEREAELSGRLRHPNVVSVVDVGTIDDLPYLATEFAEGSSLAELLLDAPLPASRANALLRQICGALHHAHGHGLIHRDLRPSNVIVEPYGDEDIARLLDFGIAILREPDGEERLTTRGVLLGNPSYMAPELALGRSIDHRLDLYALGVISYQLLTGVLPFEGDGVDIALANINSPVPPMCVRAPTATVDPLLEVFTSVLLAKDPNARPADANEARKLLELIDRDRDAAAAALGLAAPAPVRAAPQPAAQLAVRRTELEFVALQPAAPECAAPQFAAPPPVAPQQHHPIVAPADPKPGRSLIRTIAMWGLTARPTLPKLNVAPRIGSGTTRYETEAMVPIQRPRWWLWLIVAAIIVATMLVFVR